MARVSASLTRNEDGAAAAEMAIAAPLLLILMFGAMELGNYFLAEHVVAKAVRDGARYAARQSFAEYDGCTPSTDVVADTRNLTRTGQVASGGTARLPYWTDGTTTITVTASCDTSGSYSGIYNGSAIGAPTVRVAATVAYSALLPPLGVTLDGANLNAESVAAVTGI